MIMTIQAVENTIPLAQIKVDSTEYLDEGLVIHCSDKHYEIIFIMSENDILATEVTLH